MSQHDYAASKEMLNKTIHDLRVEQTALKERGDDLRQNLEAKSEALTSAVRQLNEARAVASTYKATGTDAATAMYIQKDAEAIATKPGAYLKGDGGAVQLVTREYDDGSWEPGLLDDPEPQSKWQHDLQKAVDTRNFVRSMMKSRRFDDRPVRTPRCDRAIARVMRTAPAPMQKIFADSSAIGAEWIPDVVLPELERTAMLARRVESLFRVLPLPASGSVLLPFLTTGLRPYKKSVPSADDPGQYSSSSLVTADRTITAASLAVRAQIDEDATEDSILATESIFRDELVRALVDGSEDCILNGDTAASHQDTGIANWNIRSRWGAAGLGGTDDHRRLWIGLRARATDVSNTTDQGSAQTTAGFGAAMAKLDSPHAFGSLVAITSPEYMLVKMLLFAEVLTVDKYGANASVVTGELGSLLSAKLILSEFVDKEYNASGVYDDTTKTKTGLIICDTSRFGMGVKRGARVELDKDISRGVVNMVATERKTFYTVDPAATGKNVHWSYNLSPS